MRRTPPPPPRSPQEERKPDPPPGESEDAGSKTKRTWPSRLAELALWATVALVTAVILVRMSERLLPTNF